MGNESGAKKSGLIVQVQSVRTNPRIDRVNVIVGATLVVALFYLGDPVAEQGLDWGGQFRENGWRAATARRFP